MKEEVDSTENKIVELYEELLKKTVDEMKLTFSWEYGKKCEWHSKL
jgi:hypothetical protein